MKKFFNLSLLLLLISGCATERFIVSVRDTEGLPVSNATVHVKTMNKVVLFGSDRPHDFTTFTSVTDADGRATVPFTCKNGAFEWWVTADGYYGSRLGTERFAGKEILSLFYIGFRLDEHEKAGEVTLWPKKNQSKKYIYSERKAWEKDFLMKNGRYAFDLEMFDWLPPYGRGKVADFIYVRDRKDDGYLEGLGKRERWKAFVANPDGNDYPNETDVIGHLEFPDDATWYISEKIPNQPIETTYEVETNRLHAGVLPVRADTQVLTRGQYMVICSRVKNNKENRATSAHYTLVKGPFHFMNMVDVGLSIFGVEENDLSLEYDLTQGLMDRPR